MKDSSIVTKEAAPLDGVSGLEATRRRFPWRTAFWVAAATAGSLAAGIVGVSTLTAFRLARPNRLLDGDTPPEGSFEGVSFPSTDGLQLSGWFLPAQEAGDAIILCHGFQTDRREMLPLALALRERRHHVLLFDFRGHGESGGRWSSCGGLETRDLEGAVRYLRTRQECDGKRFGVLGFSMGAAVAILTAARLPEIDAVVADSSFATLREAISATLCDLYHLPRYPVVSLALWLGERLVGTQVEQVRPLDVIPDLSPRPILIIHGTGDRMVPLSEAYLLYEAAGEPRELWTVAGADHVAARLLDFPTYLDRVDGFFKKQLAAIAIA